MPSAQQEKSEAELDFTNLHLYGREKEIAVLKEAYKKSFNSCQVVWLEGYSGVGKSTLVDFVFQDKEFYCSGKFERVRHVVPYSALVDLLSKICYNLEFDGPAVELGAEDASLLSKLVPEVKDVLEHDHQQHQNAPYNMEWGLERLKQAIQSFVRAVCEKILLKNKLPLVLFLDDLQWSDADTLAIMKDLLSADIEGLLFVGSYRDNEVDHGDPLSSCIHALAHAKSRGSIAQLSVTNLNIVALNHLVADLTHMRLEDVEPLSQLIHSKTDGNCFFSLHMLRYLSEKGFLYVSQNANSWKWKEERIQANIDVTENVVDFMTKKLQELPLVTLNALMIAACLGTTCINNDLLESLMPLLKPVADFSDFVDVLQAAESCSLIEMYPDRRRFRFSHDKVADVVYELVSGERKAEALHLEIGRKLHSLHVEAETEVDRDRWRLFLAVDQYNRGSELIESRIERVELAELNLCVALEVIKTSAFKLASAFLDNGIGLLGVQRWEKHYDLTLKLSNLRASVLLGQGVLKGCLALVKQIYRESRCPEDRHEAQLIHVQQLGCANRLCECLDVGLSILKELGHPKIPRKPRLFHIVPGILRVKKALKGMTDYELLHLPRCTDSRNLLIMRHMSFLSPIAYFADEEDLIPVLTFRMMQITLRSGISEMSPFAFAGWAIAMSVMNDFEGAVKFGRLALRLMERFPQDARTLVSVHGLISHLRKPLQACIDDTLNGYHLAFSKGDLKYAGQAIVTHFAMRFRGGFPLEDYVKDMFSFCRQLRKYRQSLMFLYLLFLLRTALEITGRSKDISSLLGKELNDEEFEDYIRKRDGKQALFNFWICHMESRYYLGDMDSALAYGEKCWRIERRTLAFLFLPSYFTFSALTSLRFWKNTGKRRHWKIFRKYHRKVKNWVKQGNPNSRHLDALLDAELLATKLDQPDAIREAYEKSILLACQGSFVQDAALASELAGRFFLRTRFDTYWARYYLSSAKELFASWNATAKVKQMQEEYGRFVHLDEEPDTLSSSHTSRSKLWNLPSHGRSRSSLVSQIESERCSETLMEPIDTNDPKEPECDSVSESKMEIY